MEMAKAAKTNNKIGVLCQSDSENTFSEDWDTKTPSVGSANFEIACLFSLFCMLAWSTWLKLVLYKSLGCGLFDFFRRQDLHRFATRELKRCVALEDVRKMEITHGTLEEEIPLDDHHFWGSVWKLERLPSKRKWPQHWSFERWVSFRGPFVISGYFTCSKNFSPRHHKTKSHLLTYFTGNKSGQIIATSHDLTPNGGLLREFPGYFREI